MRVAVRAYPGEGLSVIYEYNDGGRECWRGGTPAWRNRNPGNVIANGIAWRGKIGEAGRFCVFASPEWGMRVVRMILANRRREGCTLAAAIGKYAPACENDTAAYVQDVAGRCGLAADVPLAALDEVQMEAVAQAIVHHEGCEVGVVEVL